jgi:hypothetical protein
MVPTCAQKEKKPQKRKKRGSSSFPFAETWPCAPEATKKNEKGEQALSLPNLRDGILEVPKKTKRKEGACSPSAESW